MAKAAIVVSCVLLHLGFFALVLRGQDPAAGQARAARPLVVEFIARHPALHALPPMPRAGRSTPTRSLRAVRIDPPTAPRDGRQRELPDTAPALPAGRRISDTLPAFIDAIRDGAAIAPRDPMHPIRPRLPGSEVAIVEGIRLRHRLTPEDVVRGVGALFGGNYDPCPDLLGKMHDATVLHPHRYSDPERRALVERERHCRYR